MTDIAASLKEFGADSAALRLLDQGGPDLLPCATFITARRTGNKTLCMVEAVYEWQATVAADSSPAVRLFEGVFEATVRWTKAMKS